VGQCIFCGEEAGWFKHEHVECRQKHDEGEKAVWALALKGTTEPESLASTVAAVERTSASAWVAKERVKQLLVVAWEQAAEAAVDRGVLTREEENCLGKYAHDFQLTQEDLNVHSWQQRVAVAAAIRDLDDGRFPDRCHLTGDLPFNLQAKERLAWLFPAVCYEQRARTEYVGGSQGLSVRLAKGLYYRTSVFKGRPVVTSFMSKVGAGLLGLTDKHIYFHCPQSAFRIAYKKIVAFEPYEDGIGVHQEAVSAKPKVFITGDGWSAYHLAAKLSQQA
jgi:hypothetical protein